MKLRSIKTARRELAEYGQQMSEYERGVAQRALAELRQTSGPDILGGVLSELDQALDLYRKAQGATHTAVAREIARWSPSRLRDEMQLASLLIDQALRSGDFGALSKLYEEARASDDQYKQRALAESVKSALASAQATGRTTQEQRLILDQLARRAAQDLAELRTTPELEQSRQLVEDCWLHFSSLRQEAREAGLEVNGVDPVSFYATGPLAQTLKRVRQDPETGRVTILPEDSPEVTGVLIKGAPKTFGD